MVNKKYLPSKKFLIALSIAVVIILAAVIINYWKPNITQYKNNDLAVDTSAVPAAVNIDSDNDGLVDWKENLYGTDPHKADTDGDGTNDAEEVAQNRDPIKANTAPVGQEPNDKIDPAVIEENKNALAEYEKLNEIDKFSRDLISNIIASQPISGQMDQDTTNLIMAKALGEIPQKDYAGITKATDLNLQKTDSTNLNKNMTNYANSFARETGKYIPILGKDMELIYAYISDDSTSTKSEMLKITDKYQEIVDNLIKMPVPVALGYYDINYHLTIINDFEKLIIVDKDVVNSSPDSLSIFSNLAIYNKVVDDLLTNLTTIDGILKIKR